MYSGQGLSSFKEVFASVFDLPPLGTAAAAAYKKRVIINITTTGLQAIA